MSIKSINWVYLSSLVKTDLDKFFDDNFNVIKDCTEYNCILPRIVIDQIDQIMNDVISLGLYECGEGPKATMNRTRLRLKLIYVCNHIWYHLSFNRGLLGGRRTGFLAEIHEGRMSRAVGDSSRNRTATAGWQEIKNLLLQYKVIYIVNNNYAHFDDVKFSRGYSFPMFKAYEQDGVSDYFVRFDDSEYRLKYVGEGNFGKYSEKDLELVTVKIEDRVLIRSLTKAHYTPFKLDNVKCMTLLCEALLEIKPEDAELARQTLANHYRNLTTSPEDLERYKHSSRLIECSIENGQSEKQLVGHARRLRVSRSKTYRLFSNFTCLPRDVRQFISIKGCDEKLMQIDAKSSQFVLAALLYWKETNDSEKAKKLLIELTKGDFYGDLLELVKSEIKAGNQKLKSEMAHNILDYDRDDFKGEAFHAMFQNNWARSNNSVAKLFNREYPEWSQWMDLKIGNGKTSKLPSLLQQTEAQIFIGTDVAIGRNEVKHVEGALEVIYKQGAFALSIHDSLVVPECSVELAYNILVDKYTQMFPEQFNWIKSQNVNGTPMTNILLKIKNLSE